MSGDYANQWLKAAQEARELEARCAQLEAERNEYAERLQWLRDLREREGSWGKPYEQAMAATDPRGGEPYECEEERDRLQERCARLQQALKELRAKVVPSLIAVKGHLDTPYVDDERWTPWTRFVEPCLYRFDEVLNEALAGPDTPADTCPECGSGLITLHIAAYPCSRRNTPADGQEPSDESGYPGMQGLEALATPDDSQEDKT